MLRRQALAIGSVLLSAITLGGWTLFKRKGESPLLLSARDDADGNHYAVGYRLDGKQVFATQVGQRCHDIINHPSLPIALFVARRPGTESYLWTCATVRCCKPSPPRPIATSTATR